MNTNGHELLSFRIAAMPHFGDRFESADISAHSMSDIHCLSELLWLRCLSARGQRRAQMPNFVFHIVWIFDGLRDFLADEPAITTPQIVELFSNPRLCYRQGSSQILIRNICALRGKINAQCLK